MLNASGSLRFARESRVAVRLDGSKMNLARKIRKAPLDEPGGHGRVVGFTLPGFKQVRNFGNMARNRGHLTVENY